MANAVKIQRFKEGGLSEIYQDVEIKFAFVTSPKEGYKQCHPLVMCRDFLHDAVSAFLHKTSVSIYGFYYKRGGNPPLDMRKTRMLVKKAGKDSAETFKAQMKLAKKLLVHYEKMAGLPETKILRVTGDPSLRLFISSSKWMKAPHLVSLYTLLIRLGARPMSFKTNKELQKEFQRVVKEAEKIAREKRKNLVNDLRYLKSTGKWLDLIMVGMDKLVQEKTIANYPEVHTNTLHNYGGVVSLCGDRHFDKKLKEAFKKLTTGKSK